MASHAPDFGRVSALPLSVALRVIPSLPRPLLARFVARAIERLDEMEGGPDLEDDDPRERAWIERHSDFAMTAGAFVREADNEDDEDNNDHEQDLAI